MSVRIHQISKKTGVGNKELIALLRERGFNVTSASSSIDNISAESLISELAASTDEKEAEETAGEAEAAETGSGSDGKAPEAPPSEPSVEPSPSKPSGGLPAGVFVKSAEDVKREREKKEESKAKTSQPVPSGVAPPPPPAPAKPAAPEKLPAQPGSAVRSGSRPPSPPAFPERKPAPGPPSRPEETPAAARDEEKAGEPVESEPADGEKAEEELKLLPVKPPIVVRDFAELLGMKPFRLISELMENNIFASMNQVIDENVATDIAEKHGYLLDIKHRKAASSAPAKEKGAKREPEVDETKFLEPRPPVVCILGHVDHGKTTLLDFIRKEKVAAGEQGGITQHIGAYQVEARNQKITFLDTPGHAAFTKMRARGAEVTDIAVLVVAADDGFKPQTDEALKHAQAAAVPVIVAVNKIDVKGADIDRVKRQMQERGIPPEELGGETIVVPVSALKGDGVDDLLEMIALQAEILELKANPRRAASGIIIESEIEVGRGPTATVIVRHGTLKTGDVIVSGDCYAKVRAMFDERGKAVKRALPSTPVRVMGWSDAPDVGGVFEQAKDEREARRLVEDQKDIRKREGEEKEGTPQPKTLDNLLEAIESTRKTVLRVVVRCDVQGSVEAVTGLLESIESDKMDLETLQAEVGMITKNDVLMASAADAAIIGFGVKLEPGVPKFAKHHSVPIYQFGIIYQLVDQVKEIMAGMLKPEHVEHKLGAAEVRQVFSVKKGVIAGCLVTEGKVGRDAHARLLRKGETVIETKVVTLKRFKDDATEVRAGLECGIGLQKVRDYEEGDIIECFEIQERRQSL